MSRTALIGKREESADGHGDGGRRARLIVAVAHELRCLLGVVEHSTERLHGHLVDTSRLILDGHLVHDDGVPIIGRRFPRVVHEQEEMKHLQFCFNSRENIRVSR